MATEAVVVNIRNGDAYDVYIGRPGPFGNPFPLTSNTPQARRECIIQYWNWIWSPKRKALRQRMRRELAGKRLGCFCHPALCHGHVIQRIISTEE